MFDSKADPFNIVQATPFKRDPLKELAAECRKQGIKLGFYHSQDQDWTAPGGAALQHLGSTQKIDQHKPPTNHWDPAQDGSFPDYLHRKAIPQIRELLTNYGEAPAIVWFDTPTKDMTPELAGEIVSILNEHPKLIWNNRLGGGYRGDTETPEQYIPPQGFPGRDWESCMTMNDTWGYKQDDTNFKSTETLAAKPDRYRQQGRQLPAEHWADGDRRSAGPGSGAAAGNGQMAGGERRVDLCDAADAVRRRGGRLLGHGKRQKRQSEVCAKLEVAIDNERSTKSTSIYSSGRAPHFTWTRYPATSRVRTYWRTRHVPP